MKYQLIDNQKRSTLYEGRNSGLAFAFCRLKDDTLITIQPLSPCKDYLNDIVYSEYTGRSGDACGLHTEKTGVFEGTDVAYMVMSVLGRGAKSPTPYDGMDNDIKLLDTNHRHMQTMVNWFEERFNVKGRTVITQIKSNLYAICLPLFWTEGSYLISLYGLILRVAMYWDGAGSAYDAFKTHKGADTYHVTSSVPKIERMLKGCIPKQNLHEHATPPHSLGIISYSFPPLPPVTSGIGVATAGM